MVCAELRGPKTTNAVTTKPSRTQVFAVNIAYLLKVMGQIACELTKLCRIWETSELVLSPGPATRIVLAKALSMR
jgi:hypothetical protein